MPNRWGFAFVDVFSGVPTLAHQAGTWPSSLTVTVLPGATGQVAVTFPSIGLPGGVAHVTAVTKNPEWCQLQKLTPVGANEVVTVQCYRYGGAPVYVPFTILFEQSTGMLTAPEAFAYVQYNGSAIVTQFNSAAGTNTVTPGPPGIWTVSLPGVGSAGPEGGVQVTALDPTQLARCKVGNWASSAAAQTFEVRCHNATSVPLKTGWTLTYQRQRAITGTLLSEEVRLHP